MKTLILFLLLISGNLFSQNFDWVKREGSAESRDLAQKSIFDASGNMYVIGTFGGLNGESTVIGNTTLTSIGKTDLFLAKYDSQRNLIWVKSAGSILYEYIYGIELDNYGNILIAGIFGSSIGNQTVQMHFGNTTLTGYGKSDLFIAKYDSNGQLLWAKSYGSTQEDQLNGMSNDNDENVYISGSYKSTIAFGNVTLTNNTGLHKAFVCKLNYEGNFIWVRNSAGTSTSIAVDIATDASGNSAVTGFFSGTMILNNISNTSAGDYDAFIAKYNSSGDLLWFISAGNIDFDYGLKTDISDDGSILMTGTFQNAIDFGNGNMLPAIGGTDLFVCKYNSNGVALWSRGAGTAAPMGFSGDVSPSDAILDDQGNTLLTGYFDGNIIFEQDTLYRAAAGLCDGYLVRYSREGDISFIKQMFSGGTMYPSYIFTRTLTTDPSGSYFVSGHFLGRARFGDITVDAVESMDDMFITRIGFSTTSVSNVQTLPGNFVLDQNYPNPFNPETVIGFEIKEHAYVSLEIHDTHGRHIETLFYGPLSSGTQKFRWYASEYSSGVYFYSLKINGLLVSSKPMVLLK